MCYYLLAGGLFLFFIGKHFLSKGMFFDGVIYAAISHNMANGIGSFWTPFYTTPFFSHPPLVFAIESRFFQIFGDSYLVEKMYSVFTYILSAWLIVLLWHKTGYSKRSGWIPLLCWILMPKITWAAPNNMLKNTMTVFILASIFCYLESTEKHMALWSAFGSFLWLCAILCKGPIALFIAGFPVLYRLFAPTLSWKKLIRDEALFVGGLCLWTGLLLLAQPQCRLYFNNYLHTQIIGSLIHTQQSRSFHILLAWAVTLLFCCGALLYNISWYGHYGRDKTKLSDMENTFQYLPENITICMSPSLRQEWDIYANFVRFKGIRTMVENCGEQRFYLSDSPQPPSVNHTLLTPQNKTLFLFEHIPVSPSPAPTQHRPGTSSP